MAKTATSIEEKATRPKDVASKTAKKAKEKQPSEKSSKEKSAEKGAKPSVKKGKKKKYDRPLNLQQDELDNRTREDIIVTLLSISFFSFSITKLGEIIEVDKDTLIRYQKSGAKRKADRINDVWFQIKDIFGLSTADMRSFGKSIAESEYLFSQAKKTVEQQLGGGSEKEKVKEGLRYLSRQWVFALLKNDTFSKEDEPTNDWWVRMKGLKLADAGTFFNALAAFYLRCHDQLKLRGRSKAHVAEVRALFENLQRELYGEGYFWIKPSSLKDDKKKQDDEENVEHFFDVLLSRHSFCPMVNVTYGGLLLRAAVDPQLMRRLKSVGDSLVVGHLTWWIKYGAQPTDEDARLWLLIEPTVGSENQLSTPLYQLLEYKPDGAGCPTLHRIHQLTFFRLKQRMHCYTFDKHEQQDTTNVANAEQAKQNKEKSKTEGVGDYTEWEWRMGEDHRSLFLNPKTDGAVFPDDDAYRLPLPRQMQQLSANDADHNTWWSLKERLSEEQVAADRLKFICDRIHMTPLSKKECEVKNVIIDRFTLTIVYAGTRGEGKFVITFSEDDNERFRILTPQDEVYPITIELGADTQAKEQRFGFHFPKVGTVYK